MKTNRFSVLTGLCLFLSFSAQAVWAEQVSTPLAASRTKPVPDYSVKKVKSPPTTEYQLFYQDQHFVTAILDQNKAVVIRYHPGKDPNGWGTSQYPGAFFPGAVLQKGKISAKVVSNGISLKTSGVINVGAKSNFGSWTMPLTLGFDPTNKKVVGFGTYNLKLKKTLNNASGDLNVFGKVASNLLDNVALDDGTTGITGDMKQVDVTTDSGSYTWNPILQPGFFPQEQTANMTINIVGQYNNVDWKPKITAAYKPNLKLIYSYQSATARALPIVKTRGCGITQLIPTTLLFDHFGGTIVNKNWWYMQAWKNGGTYLGETQLRTSENEPLPSTANSFANIRLDLYNPTGHSLYGTQIISSQEFTLGQGIIVTVVAKARAPFPRGSIIGMFFYKLQDGSDTIHSEIDAEVLGNKPNEVQTNVYNKEPLGTGHPISYPYESGTATDTHEYIIQWFPDRISWLVDGTPVRSVTNLSQIPTDPMKFYINIWGAGPEWADAYDASLKYTDSASKNQTFLALIDSVKIESLSAPGLAKIVVSPSAIKLEAGKTQQLTADPQDQSGTHFDAPITWDSDDKNIATVDGNGLVTAVADGITNIKATSGSIVGTCSVAVGYVSNSPIPLIFGGTYDQTKSQDPYADNVGITPVILNSPSYPFTMKKFSFSVSVEATALPGDN